MAGRKPLPTRIKELKGGRSTYHRAMPKNEPHPDKPDNLPPTPKYLDGIGRREWLRAGKTLLKNGLLTELDLPALEMRCFYYSRFRAMAAMVKKHGDVIETQAGDLKKSPYCGMMDSAGAETKKWMVEFGETPSSRSRINIPKPKGKNALDDFLSKGKKLRAVK